VFALEAGAKMNIHMGNDGGPVLTTADRLIYEALHSLGTPFRTRSDNQPHDSEGLHRQQGRQLLRAIDSLTWTATSDCWARWRTYSATASATLPIEDELFVTKRELRRAHAMIAALQQR
jgi:hypothetical protein